MAKKKWNYKKIYKRLTKLEGKKSQVSYGNMKEIVRILIDIEAEDIFNGPLSFLRVQAILRRRELLKRGKRKDKKMAKAKKVKKSPKNGTKKLGPKAKKTSKKGPKVVK